MSSDRPNVIIITSEDNGPHLSSYGDVNVQTPNLDGLAASGTRFENAYVTQAICSPGRASILTGLYPHQNGQIGLATHGYQMFEGISNLPSLLHDQGYQTGRIGKLHVNPESAFAFDWVWNPSESISFENRDVAATADAAGEFMRSSDGPFFLMANYADAHVPYIDQDFGVPETPLTADEVTPPPEVGIDTHQIRESAAGYYNCLRRLDTGIGLLLNELNDVADIDNTIIIYVTDHGAQFARGKGSIYELGLRAPLIIRWPGESIGGTVRSELVSQIDIMPTVLDAVGLDVPGEVTGKSLRPLLSGELHTEWRSYLFAEWNTGPARWMYPQRSVRDQQYKLIHNMLPGEINPVYHSYIEANEDRPGPTPSELHDASDTVQEAYARWKQPPEIELYDLQNDPYEFNNLGDNTEYEGVRKRLLRVLREWQTNTGDKLADRATLERFVHEHDQKDRDQLHPGSRWAYEEYLQPDDMIE